jgi:hypothetical protein
LSDQFELVKRLPRAASPPDGQRLFWILAAVLAPLGFLGGYCWALFRP